MEQDTGAKVCRCERAEDAEGTAKGSLGWDAGSDDGRLWTHLPGFESRCFCLLCMRLWASYLTSPCLIPPCIQ